MQIMGKSERIRLKVDLTKYNEKCKVGELGWTIPNHKFSIWGSQDRFVAVEFDNGAKLDILYNNIEIIPIYKQNSLSLGLFLCF